ncbi:MAG: NAD(P)/FAD-dependent oxidoreductase [Acidobacteriota bacterium]
MIAAERYDAIVVGAGPAGSASASVLAQRGRRVLLLEKDRFPRPKVCGEFLSGSARASLALLGVREQVDAIAERISRGTIHLPRTGAVAFALPRPALGVSRLCLDALLASRAENLGAECRFGTRVIGVDGAPASGFRVRFTDGQGEGVASGRAVVGAWGRWDSLDRALARGFLARGGRFLGWSRDYAAEPALSGEVRLYAFPGGYCGLSRVEGGAVNLAGVVSERLRRRLDPGWDAVVKHARSENPDLERDLSSLREGPIGFLGTGPVFFTAKPPAEGGMLMVGDAAGVIDPFSGEGQAAALSSGILAAEMLERALSGEIPLSGLPALYTAAWKRRFRRRFGWSAAFRALMLHPTLGRLATPILGPTIVRFAIRKLTADR